MVLSIFCSGRVEAAAKKSNSANPPLQIDGETLCLQCVTLAHEAISVKMPWMLWQNRIRMSGLFRILNCPFS